MVLYAKVTYEVMDFTSFDIQESTDEIEITESEFYLLGVHFKKIDNSRYRPVPGSSWAVRLRGLGAIDEIAAVTGFTIAPPDV